jgi:hypothetical protein
MANDDKHHDDGEFWADWPKNDWKTEASLRVWDAWVDAKDAVKDWRGR